MITIEMADKKEVGTCPCCGGIATKLTRFVYKNENAYAIYFALYTDIHPEKHILVTISLGKWDDNTPSETRTAFSLLIRPQKDKYDIEIIDREESPWKNSRIIGKTLTRKDALKHPLIKEVFNIVDHIIQDDYELIDYINS
jgi:hypothetical protein